MPYIAKEGREELNPFLKPLTAKLLELSLKDQTGAIAYVMYYLLVVLTKRGGWACKSTIFGSLQMTLHEFFRREVGPYENGKLSENGDVP